MALDPALHPDFTTSGMPDNRGACSSSRVSSDLGGVKDVSRLTFDCRSSHLASRPRPRQEASLWSDMVMRIDVDKVEAIHE
ncbi:hypothetical protein J6590_022428 [Homalodisca vitripennis]|nr:hypothetical protein J6590_022428 [Homalodisca vitripennis]